MYCIKYKELNNTIKIEGNFANEIYKTITIRISPC